MKLYKQCFRSTENFWMNLRRFAFYNKTIFEIFFVLLYALEQVILIFLTFKLHDPQILTLAVSLFAVIVLTTFSFHKFVMESRIRYLEQKLDQSIQEKEKVQIESQKIEENYTRILELIESKHAKDLNDFDAYKKTKKR